MIPNRPCSMPLTRLLQSPQRKGEERGEVTDKVVGLVIQGCHFCRIQFLGSILMVRNTQCTLYYKTLISLLLPCPPCHHMFVTLTSRPPPFPNLMNIPTHPCQPPAFQNAELDSLSMTSLGPGEFPSITNFDRSGSALPRFPLEANQPMPTIQEEVCDFSPCL